MVSLITVELPLAVFESVMRCLRFDSQWDQKDKNAIMQVSWLGVTKVIF